MSARRINRIALAICVLLMGLPELAASRDAENPRPHVLLISVESLRWDHLGIAGYHRPVSPHIDRLAERGVYFTRAYAQGSWTRPSVASTFSSAFQSVHRVGITEPRVLSQDFVTLAEILSTGGYRTYGWTSNSQIAALRGFDQGFDEYLADDVFDEEIEARVKALAVPSDRPFFAFVHLMRTHNPFNPSERFDLYDTHPSALAIGPENLQEINEGRLRLTPDDVAHNVGRYDGTIQESDARIGEIVNALEKAGLIDQTLIVVMADHGEHFYERGRVAHGNTLYESLIRVPLVFSGPDIPAGVRVEVPVQNIDVLPTLTRLALGRAPRFSQGRDLIDLMQGHQPDRHLPIFSERGVRGQRAIIEGAWKYITGCSDPAPGHSECVELYNVVEDPHERVNRIDEPQLQDLRNRLTESLHRFVTANERLSRLFKPMELEGPLPKPQLERLRALGYLR